MPTIVDSKFHTNHTLELNQAIDRGSLPSQTNDKNSSYSRDSSFVGLSPPKTRSVLWQLIDKSPRRSNSVPQ